MDNLLALFNKIQQISPLSLFEQEQIIVQNAGMQHWLNMSIAETSGISMNVHFSLPAQFLWKLLRDIASDDDIPEQSPYSREVLVWRIFELLAQQDITDDNAFAPATSYWHSAGKIAEQQHKRYQLAVKLADLYEQYLIFRPQWIDQWSQGDFTTPAELTDNSDFASSFCWQGKLWQHLHQQSPYNPNELMRIADQQLPQKVELLPKRISFFGINAMPPMWLNFLERLGQYVDIHFFHLNPCADFWGDIQTEKQLAKQVTDWVDNVDDIASLVGNPLLANWGQQGREFLSLLQNISTINIDVFEDIDSEITVQQTILSQLQRDILQLTDARQAPSQLIDDSLTITSCHSPFREVQALHDWLLHQFNQDPELTPKDILVMCPEVEQYAPYVHAVFTRGWHDIDENIPPLPCSIADRNAQDADPLVAAFVELLSLPDSRFHVTSVVAMLRLPAIQQQFDLTFEDINTLSFWLEQAAVHWGMSIEHKAQVLNNPQVSNAFTWQQGLSKLIRGFAFGDEISVVEDRLTLPYVEGDNARLLGQLMLFLENLQHSALTMAQNKTPLQWQKYLSQLVESLYHPSAEESINALNQAIGLLAEYTYHANFGEQLSLEVVREFLTAHFATPDTGRQFMIGQVTFCSMLPMRSIPFKVIAVLGLNDGDYPRLRQPLAFDLMATSPAKLGDRSRRGDDRYLFLEALVSAQEKLYLSYQGRSIQNNKTREPSIILQELFDYLSQGYGWKCQLSALSTSHESEPSDIRQMPLQAFSQHNYLGKYPSFDRNWLQLVLNKPELGEPELDESELNKAESENNLLEQHGEQNEEQSAEQHVADALFDIELDLEPDIELEVELDDVIRFYQHPSKYYAQRNLSLYFEQQSVALSDVETFSYDRLASYQLKQTLLQTKLAFSGNNAHTTPQALSEEQAIGQALFQAKLSGSFADSPITDSYFDKWLEDNNVFANAIIERGLAQTLDHHFKIVFTVSDPCYGIRKQGAGKQGASKQRARKIKVGLSANLPIAETANHAQTVAFYRSSTPKAKDLMSLYFAKLMTQLKAELVPCNGETNSDITTATEVIGCYFDTKQQKVIQYHCANIAEPLVELQRLIETYVLGQQQPLLVNAAIADKAFAARTFEQVQFENYWFDANSLTSPGHDPYMKFFWPQCPELSEVMQGITPLYQTMYQVLEKVK